MLKLDHINKTFNSGTINAINVFTNLNLDIKEGSFITIIGGNGAGKSTLFNLISGQFLPDSGQIFLSDRDITKDKEHQRAHLISRVFQNPLMGTSPNLTVAENMALAFNKGKPLTLNRALKRKNLDKFRFLLRSLNLGLENKTEVPVKFLSGGQRQALTLLMCTMTSPQLLLLDEHTAALDPKTATQVMDLTTQIIKEKKFTTLMITHNLEQAIKFGDRLLMLHHGKIILDIAGKEKKNLTTTKLFHKFQTSTDSFVDSISSDRLLFA